MRSKTNYKGLVIFFAALTLVNAIFLFVVLITFEPRVITTTEIVEVPKSVEYNYGTDLNDSIRELLLVNPDAFEGLLDRLSAFTQNRVVTEAIIMNSLKYDVPVPLSFGLAWSESRFNPSARNGTHNRDGSADWGLFQLNDKYRDWNAVQYFDPWKNSDEGIRYFREMLDAMSNDPVTSISAYNAGITGTRDGVTFTTLRHIGNVLNYANKVRDSINYFITEHI